ncbi:MAG: PSD1 and planctomycete cytochrome C domain-containing protein [Verrucomicrobiales bacterium]
MLLLVSNAEAVDFNEHIRPILADKCFACHGPDENERKAKLRLDTQEGSRIDLGGYKALEPGNAAKSELIARILTDDEDDVMPPRKTGKEVTKEEAELLSKWIAEGGEYDEHWAYQPLAKPEPPAVPDGMEALNPIDHFITARLAENGLHQSEAADRVTLIRRLSLDLTGLPPSQEEVAAFLKDKSKDAYARVVDRMLDDKHFGERMALYWLDLVRYADTIGYHSDTTQPVAAYRDYVINAFNENLPYDQFTREQLAGDLLPNATIEQKIASGYNRLLQTTEEGGAQEKEYRTIYAADRVRNVSSVWLGSTLGCAQCHDHKFDPFTAKDFYSMAAFFADIKEGGVAKRQPNLRLPTPEQDAELAELTAAIAENSIENVLRNDAGLEVRMIEGQARWAADAKTILSGDDDNKKKELKLPDPVKAALLAAPDSRTEEQQTAINAHYRKTAPELADARRHLDELNGKLQAVEGQVRKMLVAEALPSPRETRILPRGNWQDDSGPVVEPHVPVFLATSEAGSIGKQRSTRLDLANWITDPKNPLTARAFVNRLWMLFYGNGLSRNVNDIGAQGEPPSHPQLLDWLAAEFVNSGWDVKHMVQLLTSSRTYRQVSTETPELREKDATNRWLARQGRWRLDAELVRDTALKLAGMLADETGGESVKPYQPPGYWAQLNFPKREWTADQDATGRYRRGIYTFWCRTFPHPAMVAFDAPSREECSASRPRSNTPQQALVLLNDPVFVEAARVLAQNLAATEGTPEQKIALCFQQALSRTPSDNELKILTGLFTEKLQRYESDPEGAKALATVGEWQKVDAAKFANVAAWTEIARAVLNLYETTSRF